VLTTTSEGSSDPLARRRAMTASVLPTLRVAQLHLVVVTVAVAGAPLLVSVARSATDLTLPLVLLFLATGAALGWAVDDPAAEVLAAVPIGAPSRLRTRVAGAALLAAATCGAALALGSLGPAPLPTVGRTVEALAAATIAVAVGLVAARRGGRAVGQTAVVAGLFGPVLVASFALRWPSLPPGLDAGPIHHRWWWIAAGGALLSIRSGRDPAR
jgi:hypothetical protein